MRDYSAIWLRGGGVAPDTVIPGDREYSLSDGAEVFLNDFFGDSYRWHIPKTDWSENQRVNFGDWNALETNIATTRAYLESIQYAMPAIVAVTNRDKSYIDYLSSINRIEANLEALRTNFFTPPGYPGSRVWARGDGFDYDDMNRLEMDVKLLFEMVGKVYDSLVHCGTISAGYARGDLVV